jgi:myb proto-oncogene protein
MWLVAAMVVISFYRGNLHKVPDIPWRWSIPQPSISPRSFKTLLDKRNEALKQLYVQDSMEEDKSEGMGDNGCTKEEK